MDCHASEVGAVLASSALRWPQRLTVQSPATCRVLPRPRRPLGLGLLGAFLLLALLPLSAPVRLEAQSTPRVLVAPLTTGAGIDEKFGEKVAEEVRNSLEDFTAIEPVEQRRIDNAVKLFRAQAQVATLTPIHWRQLAGQLEADLVMIGSGDAAGSGVQVRAVFVQPWWGDELPIPEITVPDDGGSEAKEAARRIVEGFEEQLAYVETLRLCREYLKASQFDDALLKCDQAIELRQDGMQAFYSRARTLMGLQRWEEAVPDLETVLSVGPRLAITVASDAIQALAFSHVQLGDAERATNLYRQYLQLMPEDVDQRLFIALTLHEGGQVDAAKDIVEEGLALDPTNRRLAAFLESPAAYASTLADPANAPSCNVWTLEIKNREPIDVEAYLFRGGKVVPVRQASGRRARGQFLRVIRANGLATLTLTGAKPVLMFYEYRPPRQAEREVVIPLPGVANIEEATYITTAPAQQESRTLFALASPFELEPHDMRTLDLQFTCETN